MKLSRTLMCLLLVLCLPGFTLAAGKKDVPPWMENIDESGRSTYLIPKGAKRQVIGSQVLVESPSEYTARRFYEMDEYLESRFKKIEENQESLQKEFLEFKNILNGVVENVDIAAQVNDLTGIVEELKKEIELIRSLQKEKESDKIMDLSAENVRETENQIGSEGNADVEISETDKIQF